MKIVHLELAGFYTENTLYQTNWLAKCHLLDGNDVSIISTNYRWEGVDLMRVPVGEQIVENGIRLIRLPYAHSSPDFRHHKFRKVVDLFDTLSLLSPDIIMIHCPQFWSLLDVIRYKKLHPEVKLYADTHASYVNSGTNALSLHILHRIYYKQLIRKALPYLEKFFYIGEGERLFSLEVYGVPESMMEYYPLGGTLPSQEEYTAHRTARRAELGLSDADRLYVHSGKLDAPKRTEELLRAFAAVEDPHAVLAIIGSVPEAMRSTLFPLIEADKRVKYLGWKTGAELQEYLCAADLYCQPGSVSATLQNAICAGCAIMSYCHPSYAAHLDYGNILWIKAQEDMEAALRRIAAGEVRLDVLRKGSDKCARELLDYRKLAARLYQ